MIVEIIATSIQTKKKNGLTSFRLTLLGVKGESEVGGYGQCGSAFLVRIGTCLLTIFLTTMVEVIDNTLSYIIPVLK